LDYVFLFTAPAPPDIYPLSLHDALPISATADFLKALASETRQLVMQQFAGSRELTVGEIAERCGLKPSTASEHLSLLRRGGLVRSEEHTSELQSRENLVCRLLLEKKKT